MNKQSTNWPDALDCAICLAMQLAEQTGRNISLSELTAAFAAQQDKTPDHVFIQEVLKQKYD